MIFVNLRVLGPAARSPGCGSARRSSYLTGQRVLGHPRSAFVGSVRACCSASSCSAARPGVDPRPPRRRPRPARRAAWAGSSRSGCVGRGDRLRLLAGRSLVQRRGASSVRGASAPTRRSGPARLLPAVRGDVRRGGQRASCARAPTSAGARRWPGSSRSTSPTRPGPSCPTPTSSPRSPTPRAAASTSYPRPARPWTCAARSGAATGSSPIAWWSATARRSCCASPRGAAGPGRRAAHPLALLPPLSAHGAAAARPGRPGDGGGRRGAARGASPIRTPASSSCATPTTRRASCSQREIWAGCSTRLPEHVAVAARRGARATSSDAEPHGASLALLDDFPRLLVFRTFSKAYGLAGLRCGYVIGGPGSERAARADSRRRSASPSSSQAGALEALRKLRAS